jgi:hypothetical protein
MPMHYDKYVLLAIVCYGFVTISIISTFTYWLRKNY